MIRKIKSRRQLNASLQISATSGLGINLALIRLTDEHINWNEDTADMIEVPENMQHYSS